MFIICNFLGNKSGPFSFNVNKSNQIFLNHSTFIEHGIQFEMDIFVFQMQVKFIPEGTEKILR